VEFGTILLWFYVADRSPLFIPSEKVIRRGSWQTKVLLGILPLVSSCHRVISGVL
jgi:hypothetical protein